MHTPGYQQPERGACPGTMHSGGRPLVPACYAACRRSGCPRFSTEAAVRDVARFLQVLADEARLQILWLLFNHRELCVCDIMNALGISQSKASRHLATLRHAGLVIDRKEAAWSYYSIRPANNELERALLDVLRTRLAEHPDAARGRGDLPAWKQRKAREEAKAATQARSPAASGKPSKRKRAPRSRARS